MPKVPRDGKTVGLSPEECRRLLDAPITTRIDPVTSKEMMPVGTRDRALLAVLAYAGIRVSDLCYLRVGNYKTSSGLRFLEVLAKGGKERRVPCILRRLSASSSVWNALGFAPIWTVRCFDRLRVQEGMVRMASPIAT